MRTLHFGLCVADLDRSVGFYTGVGYEVVGIVPETGLGHLTMLKLPSDEFASIELVYDPAKPSSASAPASAISSFKWSPSTPLSPNSARSASVPRRPYRPTDRMTL